MRKIVAICLLLIYSVCSTGATIYMHHCGKSTSISVLDVNKVSHDSCPLCSALHDEHEHTDNDISHEFCATDDCKDVKVDLDLQSEADQLHSKIMAGKFFDFTPAIVLLPWILTNFDYLFDVDHQEIIPQKPALYAENHAVYILNCTFRI
ncbi:hypothetical protein [Sphingobacterium lactis]|uniref:Uncharacterized protein n=1 Tax=Sphingobacterium lactis TaxID=797291 RepID=A0A1H5RVD3_9SPHI|nr:hypothetical protein [Sphingobacterium lactis]SEF42285.1 hypothetical protein SAMN05421877_10180 [Sphingobacterium lactis]